VPVKSRNDRHINSIRISASTPTLPNPDSSPSIIPRVSTARRQQSEEALLSSIYPVDVGHSKRISISTSGRQGFTYERHLP